MAIGDAVDNASETSGDLNKEAWDKYNALRAAVLAYHETSGAHKAAGDLVLKALFDANSILYATTDDIPAALAIAASRIVGRASSGAIAALTAAQVLTILGLDSNLADLTTAEVQQLKNIGAATISAAQWVLLGACSAILSNIVEDTTPQLGGELDCQAHSVGFTQQTATGDGTTTIDWKLGNKFYFTFGGQNDTFTFTAPTHECNLLLVLKQDGTGSRLATWPGTVMWPAGTAPTLSTGANDIDIASFYWDGTNYFGVSNLDFSVPA